VKSTCALLFVLLLFVCITAVPNAPAQAGARTDVYHVHFSKAALGKGAEAGDSLKKQGPNAAMPGHYILLRHQEGEDWDYVAIEHLGTKATVDAAGTPTPPNVRDLSAWHTDTFVNGPAWSEFAKAMGLDDPAKSAGSVYVVTVVRAAPGHREQLEKALGAAPVAGNPIAGSVLLQHLEGGPWNFVRVERYNSWQDFATAEKAGIADTTKPDSGWLQMRDHASFHNDTITDRIAP
jgi:hypothetical protein